MSNQKSQPVETESIAKSGAFDSWEDGRKELAESQNFWLATINPDGSPHVVPVFTVWSEDVLYFTSSPEARKARNLAQEPRCTITTDGEDMQIVVEGNAVKMTDTPTLERIAKVYASKYDWKVWVENGAYNADGAAPSAGDPPYELYEVKPQTVFGFKTKEPNGATRWRF